MSANQVFLVHHHHSDLVWRRTFEEYIRVREEQILNVLELLRDHSEFMFCFDQVPIIETFLSDHPDLEGAFSEYVRQGRIEIVGGCYSIPDTNLSGGESLLRNLLYGSRWVADRFGRKVDIAWYMDAFGMSGQLPQILAKSGISRVLPGRTPGLSPEAAARGVFWGAGIDGSRVLAAAGRATVQTQEYVCNVPVTYKVAQRMPLSVDALGAPAGDVFAFYCTEEGALREDIIALTHNANQQNEKKIVFCNPSTIFKHFETRSGTEEYPVHCGELNPEFTGCYTTRIRIKQGNRQAEEALIDAEKLSSLAGIVGAPYPREALTQLWRDIALVQFHDAVCGCHIDEVSDLLIGRIHHAVAAATALSHAAATRMAARMKTRGRSIVVFNTEGWPRRDVVALDSAEDLEIRDGAGMGVPTQRREGKVCFVADVPAMGYATYLVSSGNSWRPASLIGEAAVGSTFRTSLYEVEVGERALHISMPGAAHSTFPEGGWIPEILFREDAGDLWTEEFLGSVFSECLGDVELRSVKRGPVFTHIAYQGRISGSPEVGKFWAGFEQLRWQKDIFFYEQLDRIDVRVTLGWRGHDTKIFLSVPCEVDPPTAVATYEIPYGAVQRRPYYEVPAEYEPTVGPVGPSVLNRAKGDWPALRWVDYSDARGGMTVANTGTPGHSIVGTRIHISLLRSGTRKTSGFAPPVGSHDNGRHVYNFSLLPHSGSWVDAHAQRLGVELNNALVAVWENGHDGTLPARQSLIAVEGGATVVCSAIKGAEDEDGAIVRLYETAGVEARIALRASSPISEIIDTDLFERNGKVVSPANIEFRPFEIRTFRLRWTGSPLAWGVARV